MLSELELVTELKRLSNYARSQNKKHIRSSILVVLSTIAWLSREPKDQYQQLEMKLSVRRDLENLLNARYRLLNLTNITKN